MDDVIWMHEELFHLDPMVPNGTFSGMVDEYDNQRPFDTHWEHDPEDCDLYVMFGVEVRHESGAIHAMLLDRQEIKEE